MKIKVPQYLSSPMQFAFLESDEAMLIMLLIVLGLCFFERWYWWTLVIVIPYAYMKIKKKYPRGFLKHLTYYAGIKNMKYYPHAFENRFLE